MTRADRTVIVLLAAFALAAWPLAVAVAEDASQVTITGPLGKTVVPIGTDAVYEIDGALGTVTVTIKDGSAAVTESDCPDHVCVRTGAVRTPGSVIACVPNRVIVRVGGDDTDGLDARVR